MGSLPASAVGVSLPVSATALGAASAAPGVASEEPGSLPTHATNAIIVRLVMMVTKDNDRRIRPTRPRGPSLEASAPNTYSCLLALAFVFGACSPRREAPEAGTPAQAIALDAGPGPGDARAEREPLVGPPQVDLFDALPDGGVKQPRLGVLSVPVGTREARPIMIALHGGSDHPEWACNAWRGITNGYPFLVCPRGTGNEAALAWSSPADTRARITAAVAATRKAFPEWVRETPSVVLVGFSMGATQTAYLAQADPTMYRRIVLAESAYAPEPLASFVRPWTAGGGERVIFLCTTPGCEGTYRNAARNVAKQRVPARLDIAGTKEHGMWDAVVRSMRRDWPWLVEGTPGWEAYVPPPEENLPGRTESF